MSSGMNNEPPKPEPPSSKKPAIGRKKARRLAMQALYGWSMTQNDVSIMEADIFKEFAGEEFDKDYFRLLLKEVTKEAEALDKLINPHLSRKIEEIGQIELSVLRIAAYELRSRSEIPYRVIINEALDLTKTFGPVDSFKFVNGVLDKLAKELRAAEIKPPPPSPPEFDSF